MADTPDSLLKPSAVESLPTAASTSLVCGLLLWVAEQFLLPATYFTTLVGDAVSYLAFVVLSLLLCAVTVGLLFVALHAFRALEQGLSRPGLGQRLEAQRWLLAPVVAVLGSFVLLCQDGHPLRLALSLGTFAIGLGTLFVVALVLKWPLEGTRARRNAWSLVVLLVLVWFLINHKTLLYFSDAVFGATSFVAFLRTSVIYGIPLAVVVFGVFADRLSGHFARFCSRGYGMALAAAWLGGLLWLSASRFVDLFVRVHTVILLVATWIAWHMARAILARLAGSQRARWLTQLAGKRLLFFCAVALGLVLVNGARTSSAYLAAQHTVVSRYAMEMVFQHGVNAPAQVSDSIATAKRVIADARGLPRPVVTTNLPSTFETFAPQAGLPRRAGQNVVLFFLDMKRERDIDLDLSDGTSTPEIARCFAGGVRLTNHSSNATRTVSVFPAIYSSTYGGSRNQRNLAATHRSAWWRHETRTSNLVEMFRAGGYHTRVLTAPYYMNALKDSEVPMLGAFDHRVVTDDARGENQGLLDALAANPSLTQGPGPFLLVVHILSHSLRELGEVDQVVGRVCEALRTEGLLDHAVMALTADHGVQFQEHGRTSYGRTLFQEEVHVPMVWKVPWLEGGTYATPTVSLDILPTLADLVALEPGFPMEGRSMLPLMAGLAQSPRPVFFEVRRQETPSVGVRLGAYKLIKWLQTGTYALFDLEQDPLERVNLVDVASEQRMFSELNILLEQFQTERFERW